MARMECPALSPAGQGMANSHPFAVRLHRVATPAGEGVRSFALSG